MGYDLVHIHTAYTINRWHGYKKHWLGTGKSTELCPHVSIEG